MLSDHRSSTQQSQYTTPNDSTVGSSSDQYQQQQQQKQYGNHYIYKKRDEKTAIEHQENVENDCKYNFKNKYLWIWFGQKIILFFSLRSRGTQWKARKSKEIIETLFMFYMLSLLASVGSIWLLRTTHIVCHFPNHCWCVGRHIQGSHCWIQWSYKSSCWSRSIWKVRYFFGF